MRTRNGLSGLGRLAAILSTALPIAQTAQITAAASPNLDLSQLGRVAIAGDFDSISLYTYQGQNENSASTNGSQALLSQLPNGGFQTLDLSDAYIQTMCPFVQKDGTLAGVVVGGNFTSLGGVQAQGIALVNPNTSAVTALPGLSGSVHSVYCDSTSGTVYVGGAFSGGNSTNAIAWVTGWTNLPFSGFNGPVTAITKAPNGNIVFAGDFDGLGNATMPKVRDAQVINISSANITATGTSTESGFDNPSNIICKEGNQDGSGNTWLLADDTRGSWEADFGFGFNPTMLRLYNTNENNRGTKTWRFTALPLNGIMNFTYTDSNGQLQSCTADCPLPQDNSTNQDFQFVNSVGMNAFRIDITDWYGSGGGLAGIELFQDDIYSFAVPDFNEPACDHVSTGANATSTGPWQVTPSGSSTSDYLSVYLGNGTTNTTDLPQVIFEPDIKQSGNYSITMYTPGCLQDDTCSTRGTVNVTGTMTAERASISVGVTQTNDYDKYDQIYYGYVDVNSDTFRPAVTLTPQLDQTSPQTVVAQRVRFELLASSGGLNGLFEYNPNEATIDTDFSTSNIDSAGMSLDEGASVNALAVYDQSLFVAGNFSARSDSTTVTINNIFSIDTGNATSLPNVGLNDAVQTIYQNGSLLYVGGNFTGTGDNSVQGVNGFTSYSITDRAWRPLGAGVNGTVASIVPLSLNITTGDLQDVVAVTGDFPTVNAFAQNASFAANGFAIWVPSRGNWLHNLGTASMSFSGQLIAQTPVPDSTPLLAGSISSQQMGLSNAVAMTGSGMPSLESLNLNFTTASSDSSSMKRRAISGASIDGVVDGLFYSRSGQNITVLGGHFTATASDGSTVNNLLILNNTRDQIVTGLPSGIDASSTFMSMDTQGSTLFAGGSVTGTINSNNINGVIVYDLATGALASTQPPALAGSDISVNAIASQPNAVNVYVGGNFTQAGSLTCPTLCYYDTQAAQWNTPGTGLSGSISAMTWSSNNELVIAGNLTAGGNATMMATYNAKSQTYSVFNGASSLPGPITALSAVNSAYNQFWVAGTTTANGSAYLSKYDGTSWTSVAGIGEGSNVRGLQVMSTTSNHGSTTLVSGGQVLLVTGALVLPNFGNVSAALFNGTVFQPFILTNTAGGGQGSISRIFVSNPSNLLNSSTHQLARGFVVLIALAIALGLIFLLVVAGILMNRYRRRKEGYVPMQQLRPDQQSNLGRIPPESLFGTFSEKNPAPKI